MLNFLIHELMCKNSPKNNIWTELLKSFLLSNLEGPTRRPERGE
jgi:hypothetical protein